MVVLFLILEESFYCTPQWLHQFTFPQKVHEGSLFSTSSPTLTFCFLFDKSHSESCEVISHFGFDLHFPDDQRCWASFHVSVGHLYVFFRKMSIQALCPFFNWVFFFDVELYEFFVYFGYYPSSDISFASIFSHSVGCLFILLIVSFAVQKLSSLM